jgi:hypothetical protein
LGNRNWVAVGVRLLVAAAIVGWAFSFMSHSGEAEFQKTLDAMKQVHTFRVASMATSAANVRNEALWEVDCSRNIVHRRLGTVRNDSALNDTNNEMEKDEILVANRAFTRQTDGAWALGRYTTQGTAKSYCGKLAQGADTNLLPQIATMIQRGVIQKGDKKVVNGVACREYLVTMKNPQRNYEHDTVCLGLEDHLPYELTVDWQNSHSSFSDYNVPIQIELPEAAVQTASNTTSN